MTAALEHGLVDGAMTSSAKENRTGEVGGGGAEIGVVKFVEGRLRRRGRRGGSVLLSGGGRVGVGFGEFVRLDWGNGGDGATGGDRRFGTA